MKVNVSSYLDDLYCSSTVISHCIDLLYLVSLFCIIHLFSDLDNSSCKVYT